MMMMMICKAIVDTRGIGYVALNPTLLKLVVEIQTITHIRIFLCFLSLQLIISSKKVVKAIFLQNHLFIQRACIAFAPKSCRIAEYQQWIPRRVWGK